MPNVGGSSIEVHTGSAARQRFADDRFVTEWTQLRKDCPWATVCQGPEFALPWLAVYGDLWTPCVIEGRDAGGLLQGLLLLARPPKGEWKHLGGHHAEYHTWLARTSGPEMPAALLRAARQSLGLTSLSFLFLPPNSPIDVLRNAATAVIVRRHDHPKRVIAAADRPGSALRSKRNRLRKLGDLTVEQPEGADAVDAFLKDFIPMYDDRHAGMGRGRAFEMDPRKRAYYVACARVPGLVMAQGLRLDGRLIAGHVGLRNGDELMIGMLAHAKDLDRHSPGAVLLHELDELLTAKGVHTLDLTPGGDYKTRYATGPETAWAADLGWGWRESSRLRLRYQVASPVVRGLRHLRSLAAR